MGVDVNIGGVYKSMNDGWVNINGVWKQIDSVHTNIGGVWKEGYSATKGYVATGYRKNSSDNLIGAVISYSADGKTWNNHYNIPQTYCQSATYGDGVWVAIGSGAPATIYKSVDGITWSTVSHNFPSTRWITHITYGNGIYIAVNDNGYCYKSTNLSTWTSMGIMSGTSGRFAEFINGMFFICQSGNTYTSTDGINWTTHTGIAGTGIHYSNGMYIISGTFGYSGKPQVHTSTNGTTWSTVNSGTGSNGLHHVVHFNGYYYGVQVFKMMRGTTLTNMVDTGGSWYVHYPMYVYADENFRIALGGAGDGTTDNIVVFDGTNAYRNKINNGYTAYQYITHK